MSCSRCDKRYVIIPKGFWCTNCGYVITIEDLMKYGYGAPLYNKAVDMAWEKYPHLRDDRNEMRNKAELIFRRFIKVELIVHDYHTIRELVNTKMLKSRQA